MQILSRSPSAPATPSVTSTLTGIHQPEQADPEGGAAPVRATRSELRRRGVAVALLVFVIFFVSPNTDGGDGYLVVPTAHSLIHEHNLDLSEFRDSVWYDSHYAVSEVDGRVVNYFPWLTAVFAVPVVASFDLLHTVGVAGDQATAINNATIQLQNRLAAAIVATAAAIVLALIASRLLMMMEASRPLTSDAAQAPRSSWLRSDGDWTFVVFTLVLALGTSLWSTASRSMWQHGPSMFIGGLGVLGLLRLIGADFHPLNDLRGHFRPYILGVATGTALALSYWIRPTNLVLAFLAIALLSLRQRRAIPPVLSGMLGAHLIMIGLNLVLLGVALPPYFKGSRLELHDQYLQAVAGNLISPARGLFIFSPFLLGALLLLMPSRWRLLDRNMRSYTLISLAGVGAYLLAVSGFAESWWAGISYGPRFMSESVVLMAPLALAGIFGPRIISGRRPALGYCVALAAIAFSMVTHGSGAQINGVMCWGDRGRDNYPSRVWDWSDPQFLEGPDLLIHDGLSNSMNASCPKT